MISNKVFGLSLFLTLLIPYIVYWNEVERETIGSIIFCRYIYEASNWLLYTLSFLVVVTGMIYTKQKFGQFLFLPFILFLVVCAGLIGMGATMVDEKFKFHALTVASVAISEILLLALFLVRPMKYILLSIFFLFILFVTNKVRNSMESKLVAEFVFSSSTFIALSILPVAVFIWGGKQEDIHTYNLRLSRTATRNNVLIIAGVFTLALLWR